MASNVQSQNAKMSLESLRDAVCARTEQEKQQLLRELLREVYGKAPQREHSIWNEDNSSYLFLVPPHIHVQYQMTPEFVAELDRRAAKPRDKDIPLSETIAKLEALHKEYEGK